MESRRQTTHGPDTRHDPVRVGWSAIGLHQEFVNIGFAIRDRDELRGGAMSRFLFGTPERGHPTVTLFLFNRNGPR